MWELYYKDQITSDTVTLEFSVCQVQEETAQNSWDLSINGSSF